MQFNYNSFNTKESCEYLGVTYLTFRRWIKLGWIPEGSKPIHNTWKLWTKEQLDNIHKYKWLENAKL